MIAACENPQAAAEFLRAMGHPMRLQILCRLADGELSVSGFESELGLKQPSLSQHLGQLREAGLVTTRRESRSIVYRLIDPRVVAILHVLRGGGAVPTSEAFGKPELGDGAPKIPAPARGAAVLPPDESGVFAIAGWPSNGQ